MTLIPAARGTRAPREGTQPAAAFSRSNRGLSEPFDPANYVFKAFPKDCPVQPKDAVQIADEDTGEVFVGRVVDKAAMVGNILRVGVLFEDSPNMRMVPADALTARLTTDEQTTLEQHEQIIGRGIKVFFEVGEALLAIRDSRLYRATHATFEAYCSERWGIKNSRAYQLMDAAKTIASLKSSTMVELPTNERQARALKSVADELKPLAWQIAMEASGGNPTTAFVKGAASLVNEAAVTGALDIGNGESIPLEQATPTHIKAAITADVYETMKRQQQHIAEAEERKRAALAAKAKVGELVLQVLDRDDMGYVRIADQHGCLWVRMEVVHESADGTEFNVAPGSDLALARRIVNAVNNEGK